ncbi:MAG TPA: phosphate regulon sensor histidine kinase PhoR [Ramlibacter sp.]|uniref:phosphate regulon sensor histidine kinase PhoR n=1 Tax=Ramlibacter sp. TaxID=1917967 RepID=UPI002ED0AC51
MTFRVAIFLLCLAAGGFGGWFVAGDSGAELGLALGALLWFAVDTGRGLRALRWLREGDLRRPPALGGLWGEALDRVRRAVSVREKQVEDAELRLDDFLDAIRASPNGVVLLDPRGRIEWINDTAAAHFGFDRERDLQQHIVNLLRDPDFGAFYAGRTETDDVVIPAPGSTASHPRRLSLRLHPYGEGRVLMLSRDVTAVEQADVMRRDFVANVSHEIRTPLTVLSGFVETLRSLDLPQEDRARYLQMMAQQTQRMQTLVNDLLTLSRLEGSPLPGTGEWTPVASLLAQCEQEARALAPSLGKSLELDFAPAAPAAVSGMASELQSAFSNLVSNAVRYTPTGGRIAVAAGLQADGRLHFSVHDTGPGIAPEHLPRLTERFYRVDRSRSRETGGTGLGLAIVKHVVQRHGGELRIDSTPGAGSTFSILLPAARVRPQAPSADGSASRTATESAAG